MKRLIVLIIIISIMFSYLMDDLFTQLKQHNVAMQTSSDQVQAFRINSNISDIYNKTTQDTVFLASLINNVLDQDISETMMQQQMLGNMRHTLPSFLTSHPMYENICFLDKNGNQQWMMDSEGFGISSNENDAFREYFQGALTHRFGQVHFTYDNDRLYFSSPVFRDAGHLYGVIVVTLKKDVVLRDLVNITKNENFALMEDTGKYIIASADNSSRDFIKDYSAQVFNQLKKSKSGNLETKDQQIISFTPLQLDDHQWFILVFSDKNAVIAHTSALQQNMMFNFFAIVPVFFLLIILWFFSYRKGLRAESLKAQKESLEDLNQQLVQKQYQLEEQNAMVEELYAQLEEESERYQQQKYTLQAITNSLDEGIIMTDIHQMVVFANTRWLDLFDLSGDATQVMNAKSFIDTITTTTVCEQEEVSVLQNLVDNYDEIYALELEQIRPVHRYLKLYTVPCIAGKDQALGRIFVCQDISHRKEVDQLKGELISTVSHELRTPMSSIMGFSELVLTRKLSPERTTDYIKIINSEAHRLTKLINDFLDIQRMESGRQVFEKKLISFQHVVQEVKQLFTNLDKHQVIYRGFSDDLPLVYCDHEKMVQVMTNLISNAVKYSPAGGDITVELKVQSEKLVISVTDHGLGIPEEVQDKLFNKFFRVDNDDRRKIGGTGLGLAICKEIVQAHKGKIGFKSEYGEGSTFYFAIPISVEQLEQPEASQDKLLKLPKHDAILIVEDDRSLVKLISDILFDAGYATVAVDNGEEALKLISAYDFKSIILDISLLGNLDGWDVLKQLKSNPQKAHIPVIVSSAAENEGRAAKENIAEYLVKPFDPQRLLEVLRQVSVKKAEAKMMVQMDENLEDCIFTALKNKGINAKKFKREGDILIITLDGENQSGK